MIENIHIRNYSNHVNLFFHNPLYSSDKKERIGFFLDRDGVVIKEKHFVSNPSDVFLEEGAQELLNFLYNLKIPVIIISNQSGISRKILTWNDFEEVNERMFNLIGINNPIVGIFANGLLPKSPIESWRKPSPQMIKIASGIFNIDLKNSFLIGDRLTDLKAGLNAGVNNLIHLKTGHGEKEIKEVKKFFENDFDSERKNKKISRVSFYENLNTFKDIFEKKLLEIL